VKARVAWILVAALVIALAASLTIYEGRPESAPSGELAERTTAEWLRRITDDAEQGYWLVVRGTHIGDQVVAAGSAGELTHAALLDRESGTVIEAIGKGVIETPVSELVAQAHRLVIVRPRDYDAAEGTRAVARARSHLGYGYDWFGTLGLGARDRFYCTELAVDAYRAREKGWMPPGVIHPEHMERYGDVVFDSGPRPSASMTGRAGDAVNDGFARVLDGVEGIDHVAEVAPGLYRGGLPDGDGVEWLKSRGIKTVVRLGAGATAAEAALVRAHGMHYEVIRMPSPFHPTEQSIERFLSITGDDAQKPVYVCARGAGTTGVMLALYRVRVNGFTPERAMREMRFFGGDLAISSASTLFEHLGRQVENVAAGAAPD
jgi:hypothetical protein